MRHNLVKILPDSNRVRLTSNKDNLLNLDISEHKLWLSFGNVKAIFKYLFCFNNIFVEFLHLSNSVFKEKRKVFDYIDIVNFQKSSLFNCIRVVLSGSHLNKGGEKKISIIPNKKSSYIL